MLQKEGKMPQPRKYATRAEQQAAYRQRRAVAEQALLAQKGLPPLPAIPTLPGHARWRAMLSQAQHLLNQAALEMQSYYEERSEAWQESGRAEDLLGKVERLEEIVTQLQECE
jgi:hypothetical protein